MFKARHLSLLDKATTYLQRVNSIEFTPDNKGTHALLYQVDAMIYGLASIDSSVWNGFLKTLKEAKQLLRTHSRSEEIRKDNYSQATVMIAQTLEKYVEYLQSTLLLASTEA